MTKAKAPKPPPLRTIKARAKVLGPIFTFNADAFRPGRGASEELCEAMLALALIFNDCRELTIRMENLFAETPDGPPKLTKWFGEHGGSDLHAYRMMLGLLHETGEVIEKYGKELNGPFFRTRLLSRFRPDAMKLWDGIRGLATGKKAYKGLDDFLYHLRNNAAFHYDGPALRAAYERRFPRLSTDRKKKPLASVAATMYGTRFYFADAAALELVESAAEGRNLMPLGPKVTDALVDVTHGLALVLQAFIESRHPSPWKAFTEDT